MPFCNEPVKEPEADKNLRSPLCRSQNASFEERKSVKKGEREKKRFWTAVAEEWRKW